MRFRLPFSPAVFFSCIAGTASAACPTYNSPSTSFTITDSRLDEVSGMVAMAAPLSGFWVHNDGGGAEIYGLNPSGTVVAVLDLVGADNDDWEDIAIGPGPVADVPYIYVADSGDNDLNRGGGTVYRLPQPALASATVGAHALPFAYPGGISEDCETLLSDPTSGDLYLVSRDRAGAGVFRAYRFAFPQAVGSTTTLVQVAQVATSGTQLAKGGAMSATGSEIALLFHSNSAQTAQARIYQRGLGMTVGEALAQSPCIVALPSAPQSEALAINGAGDLFVTSEGTNQPVHRRTRVFTPPGDEWIVR